MRRVLMAVAVVATLSIGQIGAQPAPPASAEGRASTECRFQTLRKAHWAKIEVVKTIRCVTKKYDVSTRKALLVAEHESGFRARARNSSSGACGIFQHIPDYWPGRIRAVKKSWPMQREFGDSCYNARSNIYAAVKLAKSSGGWDYHWCRFVDYC